VYLSISGSILRINPQQIDLYAYVENSPIMKTDPTGLIAAPQVPGCDGIPDFNRCMKKCCNAHDRCYEKAPSWCDNSSWIETVPYRPDCAECNLKVMKCVAKSFIPWRRKSCGN